MKSILKVFLIIYIPVLIVLITSSFVFKNIAVKNAERELIQEMKNKWHIVNSLQNEVKDKSILHDNLIKISEKTGLRITIIEESGKVLDDSYLSLNKIEEMENHIRRPEVQDTLEKGEGVSKRFSGTIKEYMMYYCRQLPDGNLLRLAYPMEYVSAVRKEFATMFFYFYLFLLVTIGLITLFLARKISLPVRQLDKIAEKIETGEKNIDFPSFSDSTMTHISDVIFRIYSSLNKQKSKLVEERDKFSNIFTTLEEAILLLDKDNVIQNLNDKVSEFLNIKLSKGMEIPGDIDNLQIINFFNKIFESEKDYFSSIELLSKYYEVYVRFVGKSKLIVMHDITEKEKYINYKSNLISNISHELKTPVAAIMGYSETLLSHDEMDETSRNKFLNTINLSSNRLNNLINDILELHKLEVSTDDGEIEELDLNFVLDEIKQTFALKEENVLKIQSDLDFVKMEHGHFISILNNLIGNAFKYSNKKEVEVYIGKVNDFVSITVDDHGPLIPESEKARIFERFYTISKSRNKQRAGTGLGLSIVKHIVEKYNGTIKIKDNKYGGNSFVVRF